MVAFSEDRVRRLRIVLLVVAAVAVLAAADFGLGAATDGHDRGTGIFGVVVGLVLGTAAVFTITRLPEGKRLTVATGLLAILIGMLLLGTWSAYLLPLLGIALVFLALINDDPEPKAR
jgi:peptidoglycan/LPS O-acetylase OafA/YrhL